MNGATKLFGLGVVKATISVILSSFRKAPLKENLFKF